MIEERKATKITGFIMLLLVIAMWALAGYLYYTMSVLNIVLASIILTVSIILTTGFTVVAPNIAVVLTFFGKYTGTIRDNGFWFVMPLTTRRKISMKVRNFNSERLKVNDINGNPIEIAAVIVLKVVEPTKAVFDVDNYEEFVEIQSETALRHVAAKHPYDNLDEDFDEKEDYSLRGNSEDVSRELLEELQDRLAVAGVKVLEARLTHLAYATEIASAMLQRQQASAILAARQIIVEGAVGMAQMAINNIEESQGVELDEERKMAMTNNLMVAIISDRSAQPIINTGSLY